MSAGDGLTIRTVAELVGEDAAVRIAAVHGGRRLHIPKQITERSPLADLIGVDAASKLSWRFGGLTFDVAREYGHRQRIVTMRLEGKTVCEIAVALGSTLRHVYRKIAEARTLGELPPRSSVKRQASPCPPGVRVPQGLGRP